MTNQANRETFGPTAQAGTRGLRVKRVLLVCTGNTCRSPMAAALLRDAADKDIDFFASGIEINSAGTAAISGASAPPLAIKVMKKRGIDLDGHRATRLTREVIERADLILTMAQGHKDAVVRADAAAAAKVHTIAEYVGGGIDIEDPLSTGTRKAYECCAQELSSLMPRVLQRLQSPSAANG